jgi:parvulin-like peptidyl-prolyl isomerase
MQPIPFITVDEQPIYFQQALQYLQATGKLGGVISDIVRQYALEREINFRQDLEVSPALTEQAMVDFRLQNQLTDQQKFVEWLQSNNTSYELLHQRITSSFKLARLRQQIIQPKIEAYFMERKVFLDRVVLSRILVDKQDLAEEIYTQIQEGVSFEKLAKQHSIADDKVVNGMMGPVSKGTIPDHLRAMIDNTQVGGVVGPVQLEDKWGLFRVEQLLPASLEDNQFKQALENEIFDQWLTEQLKKMEVKLQLS